MLKKNVLKICFYSFFIVYFIYHILNGDYGIISYNDINRILIEKKNLLKKKEEEYNKEKNKIKRLEIDNIDMDLFEEKLKENVGIIDKNEIVIFTKDVKSI